MVERIVVNVLVYDHDRKELFRDGVRTGTPLNVHFC